jgi:glycosyltransferase A (GT-A) superfamily protein (DUF2064 family)
VDLLVLAKEPVAGRVKTRLTPPCTPAEAAQIAEAALADTLAAAVASGADRVVLGLDGRPGPWRPPGVEVVDQGTGPLGDRLERLWSHTRGPALQIGMDTPQVTPALLDAAMATLVPRPAGAADRPAADAVLGPAEDGGWWAVGLRRPLPGCFAGVPASRPDTGARQHERLRAAGLWVWLLPTLRDVDAWPDALAVAGAAPTGRAAVAIRRVAARLDRAPSSASAR